MTLSGHSIQYSSECLFHCSLSHGSAYFLGWFGVMIRGGVPSLWFIAGGAALGHSTTQGQVTPLRTTKKKIPNKASHSNRREAPQLLFLRCPTAAVRALLRCYGCVFVNGQSGSVVII
jgi:hypothetical protein